MNIVQQVKKAFREIEAGVSPFMLYSQKTGCIYACLKATAYNSQDLTTFVQKISNTQRDGLFRCQICLSDEDLLKVIITGHYHSITVDGSHIVIVE